MGDKYEGGKTSACIDGDIIREVTIKVTVDDSPLRAKLQEIILLLRKVSPDVALGFISNLEDSFFNSPTALDLYSYTKSVSADGACHRIVFVPSGKLLEYVGALRVRAGER